MGFKDIAASDIARTFLDFDVFGQWINVEGTDILAVVDEDRLQELQAGQDLAVAESQTLFYAAEEDLPKRRIPGATLTVNGRTKTIDKWTVEMGMACVVLREALTG